jgi:hypothetical protein
MPGKAEVDDARHLAGVVRAAQFNLTYSDLSRSATGDYANRVNI